MNEKQRHLTGGNADDPTGQPTGNLKAIRPYIQVIEQFDRYRKAAARPEVYDAAARKRLFAKLNRVAAEIEAETRKRASGAAAEPQPNAETQPDSGLTP